VYNGRRTPEKEEGRFEGRGDSDIPSPAKLTLVIETGASEEEVPGCGAIRSRAGREKTLKIVGGVSFSH